MKIVILGLTISSWANGHATLWRGLCRALHRRGHEVVFYERDVPYYAAHRDLPEAEWCRIVLYDAWDDVVSRVRLDVQDADVAITTSYCPDAVAASRLLWDSGTTAVYYDLDSPVTLERLALGDDVPYIPPEGLGRFDLVLSYAGGSALDQLQSLLGARAVAPLYGSVDPEVHRPVRSVAALRNELSYLGTYAADRQPALERLLVAAARERVRDRFLVAGAQYPASLTWPPNVRHLLHLPPDEHASLFSSSGLTLNITRSAMAATGHCPSGRLFEAAACGAAIVSDWWPGLEAFYTPGVEILIAEEASAVHEALDLSPRQRRRIGEAALERTLACHTAWKRAEELERILEPSRRAALGAR